jgi:hypothetical protein
MNLGGFLSLKLTGKKHPAIELSVIRALLFSTSVLAQRETPRKPLRRLLVLKSDLCTIFRAKVMSSYGTDIKPASENRLEETARK